MNKLHLPPRGGAVERSRLEFYVDRASKTRLEKGVEKGPSEAEYKLYCDSMQRIFASRTEPVGLIEHEVFDSHGELRYEVFREAMDTVDPRSSPGFPLLYEYATNGDVPDNIIYPMLNRYLKAVRDLDPAELRALPPLELFKRGLLFPATSFVKGEPTGREKLARNIYGVSLVMQLYGRILFHDWLKDLVADGCWQYAEMKVGMDMYTQAGLSKLRSNFDMLLRSCSDTVSSMAVDDNFSRVRKTEHGGEYEVKTNLVLASDDIQGWEYQVRSWMHLAWHRAYMRSLQGNGELTKFHARMQINYAIIEAKQMVMDSDGYLHRLPYYIRMSGVVTTHIQNSDERSALSYMDLGIESAEFTNITNGDDCDGLVDVKRLRLGELPSQRMGFVHTDLQVLVDFDSVEQTSRRVRDPAYGCIRHDVTVDATPRLYFSSQIFEPVDLDITKANTFRRLPDGCAKSFYNAVTSEQPDAVGVFTAHVGELPYAQRLIDLALRLRLVATRGDDKTSS